VRGGLRPTSCAANECCSGGGGPPTGMISIFAVGWISFQPTHESKTQAPVTRTWAFSGGNTTLAPEHVPRLSTFPLIGCPGVHPGWSRGTISIWMPPSFTFLSFSIDSYPGSGLALNVTSPSLTFSFGARTTMPTNVVQGFRTFKRCGSWTPASGSCGHPEATPASVLSGAAARTPAVPQAETAATQTSSGRIVVMMFLGRRI
jgi:hypothetical protein